MAKALGTCRNVKMEANMYQVKRLTATIAVEDFFKNYVDIPQFVECCKACPNYGLKWSCPPYDFEVEDLWKQYKTLEVICDQVVFDKAAKSKEYSAEELMKVTGDIHLKEKLRMEEELRQKEGDGMLALAAGSCHLCSTCTRKDHPHGTAKEYCAQYGKMRCSIESLGGNVAKVCEELLGQTIQWISGNQLPDHLMLVGGLLQK